MWLQGTKLVAELKRTFSRQPLWDAVALLVAAQHLNLRVRQLCPGVGRALRVYLSASLQPALFTPDAPPVVAAARAAVLASLGPEGPEPPAQVSDVPGLAALACAPQDGEGSWRGAEHAEWMERQAGATPPDELGLRDLVYSLMRPLSWVAEAGEPAGLLPPHRTHVHD